MRSLTYFGTFAVAFVALQLLPAAAAHAIWPHDTTFGNGPLCTATGDQTVPTTVSDGAGGAIVTWTDTRSGGTDIYAQRVSASGTALWTANGVGVCTASGDQYAPTIAADGAGGAIVTWYDFRSASNDIYTQRVSAAGLVQWTANGVALCTATADQFSPVPVADGAGGAI